MTYYYRYSLKKFPDYESLAKMSEEAADFLSQQSEVEYIRKISKSTFYRIQRQDAQAFWNNIGNKLFPETAQ